MKIHYIYTDSTGKPSHWVPDKIRKKLAEIDLDWKRDTHERIKEREQLLSQCPKVVEGDSDHILDMLAETLVGKGEFFIKKDTLYQIHEVEVEPIEGTEIDGKFYATTFGPIKEKFARLVP